MASNFFSDRFFLQVEEEKRTRESFFFFSFWTVSAVIFLKKAKNVGLVWTCVYVFLLVVLGKTKKKRQQLREVFAKAKN